VCFFAWTSPWGWRFISETCRKVLPSNVLCLCLVCRGGFIIGVTTPCLLQKFRVGITLKWEQSGRGLFQSVVRSTAALRFGYPVSVESRSPICEHTDEIGCCGSYLLASLNRVWCPLSRKGHYFIPQLSSLVIQTVLAWIQTAMAGVSYRGPRAFV